MNFIVIGCNRIAGKVISSFVQARGSCARNWNPILAASSAPKAVLGAFLMNVFLKCPNNGAFLFILYVIGQILYPRFM